MAEEISYYSDQNGERVTDKRVIIGNTTYSMANITSISTTNRASCKAWPVVFVLSGCLFIVIGLSNKAFGLAVFGAILGVLGYFWFKGIKPIWHLRIASASGESKPLQSINQQWISSIAQAINEAIIHRT